MTTADDRQDAVKRVQDLLRALELAPATDRHKLKMALLGAREYLAAVEEQYRTARALARMPQRKEPV